MVFLRLRRNWSFQTGAVNTTHTHTLTQKLCFTNNDSYLVRPHSRKIGSIKFWKCYCLQQHFIVYHWCVSMSKHISGKELFAYFKRNEYFHLSWLSRTGGEKSIEQFIVFRAKLTASLFHDMTSRVYKLWGERGCGLWQGCCRSTESAVTLQCLLHDFEPICISHVLSPNITFGACHRNKPSKAQVF